MTGWREEQIGDCRLILADCREVLPTLPKVDAVLTDPPYGIGFAAQPTRCQRANGMERKAWDNERPQDVIDALVAAHKRVIIWGGNYFALRPTRGWLVWTKTGNAPSMADLEMAWTSMDMNSRRFEKTVSSASQEKDLRNGAHPSQKPVGLMAWCLGFVPGAGAILDPFMGSGTTGVACANLGRQFIGIEREPSYFDIACRRIEEAYRQPRLFDEPPPKPIQSSLLEGLA